MAQYKRCVDAGACSVPDSYGTWPGQRDHPVTSVDWHQATAFCAWAGGRLPTAAEWERAASNGGTTEYPWGNAEPDGTRANFCDVNCTYDWKTASVNDGYAKTSPVCSFPAGRNRDGVCDLSGNAYEWTATDYDSSNKETRGGSWLNSPRYLRAGSRVRLEPGRRLDYFGFRCAQ